MLYNTAPANTLFAKVSVKTKPYSTDPVSIRIVADVYASASSNKALYYTELPLQNTTLLCIESAISDLQARANAASVSIKMQPKVLKILADFA
jgi:hypothetical protein